MNWFGNWSEIHEPDVALGLEQELARELQPGHPLDRIPVAAIGRCDGSDDVLFRLLDATERVAVVHLTWAKQERPPWPHTTFFPSLAAWLEAELRSGSDDGE